MTICPIFIEFHYGLGILKISIENLANDNNTNSLDDLLYGKNKNMYDSPWSNQLINPHSTMGSSNGLPKSDVMVGQLFVTFSLAIIRNYKNYLASTE